MLLVDDYSNVEWVLFLKDKTDSTVTQALSAFFATIKPLIAVHGPVGSLRTDNGLEFVNDDFKGMLTELNIKRELTPVDGAKRNGCVERKLALNTEGARAAWLEFPRHFPDLQFPRKALIWDKIWPEAFSWMNDCINISVQVDDKPDMLCPWEKIVRQATDFTGFAIKDAKLSSRQPQDQDALAGGEVFLPQHWA